MKKYIARLQGLVWYSDEQIDFYFIMTSYLNQSWLLQSCVKKFGLHVPLVVVKESGIGQLGLQVINIRMLT